MWRTAIGLEQGPVSVTLLSHLVSWSNRIFLYAVYIYNKKVGIAPFKKITTLLSLFLLSFPLPSSPLFHSTEQHNPERIQTSPKRAFTAMSCQLPNPPLQKQLRHVHSESHVLLLNESDCRLSANMMVPILPIFGD